MYEDLVQELRHGELALSTSFSRRQIMNKAANAIEILSKHDAEVDEIARQSCEVRTALGCDTMDEMLELARDGRLLVLPEAVYEHDAERIYESRIRRVIYETDTGVAFDDRAVGKTVFLTREEAEAALRKEKTE